MSPHEIILAIMAVFAVLGGLDRIFGSRLGLGKGFEEGILSMGSLALSMAGIICLAPVLANVLRPVVVPVYRFLGADPAMFAGTILANDTGGAALAKELAPMNITVNCVAPGAIETDMMQRFSDGEKRELCEEIPLGRLGSPQEVARAVLFLAENRYVTGEVLSVNGGLFM